jgi:hypothetical protein
MQPKGQIMLWGQSIEFWDGLGRNAMIAGAVVGALALAVTFISSYVLYRVAEAQQAQLASDTAKAYAAAEVAKENAAALTKANTELQLQVEKERNARTAMLMQLQPRDFSAQQMEAFVAELKGKVKELHVFTIVDNEAAMYGSMIMDGLKRADVVVHWHRVAGTLVMVGGVATTGVTIYDREGSSVWRPLMDAFVKAGHFAMMCPPSDESPEIPTPSLFVMLKPPPFQDFPSYKKPPELAGRSPPWNPK